MTDLSQLVERAQSGSGTVANAKSGAYDTRAAQGDDGLSRFGSIGIGMANGVPFMPGGSRSAELLELFIESL